MKSFLVLISNKLSNAVASLFGLRFPRYFTHRDKWKVLFHGIEPDLIAFIRFHVKPGMSVLDIGGNIGLLCRAFSKAVGPQGHVWSFEPDPATRCYLDHNLRSYPNTTVSPLAICEKNGHFNLFLHPQSGTGNSLLPIPASHNSVPVICATLDSFLATNEKIQPDIVKIDVEGAEPQVICGMQKTLQRFPKVKILIEFCPDNLAIGGVSADSFYQALTDLGLHAEVILESGDTVLVRDADDLLSQLGNNKYCNLLCWIRPRYTIGKSHSERES